MPNYKYKCTTCGEDWFMDLPMSFPPDKKVDCCLINCPGLAERRIGFQNIDKQNTIVIPRETLGRWFKNKTGRKLLGGD